MYMEFTNEERQLQEAKDFILKEFFNSKNQKKAVLQAAKESAEDQKMLMKKYNELVKE